MQYIEGLKQYKNSKGAAVTFGKFDGLHLGHRMLTDAVKELSEKEDVSSVVCAFDMHQSNMLMTKEERKLHLEKDVDYLVDWAFTEELKRRASCGICCGRYGFSVWLWEMRRYPYAEGLCTGVRL